MIFSADFTVIVSLLKATVPVPVARPCLLHLFIHHAPTLLHQLYHHCLLYQSLRVACPLKYLSYGVVSSEYLTAQLLINIDETVIKTNRQEK